MASEIKPCPFCGASMRVATEYMFTHPGTFGEGECLLAGKGYHREHIDWWNTRQSTADLQAKLDKAVEALGDSQATLAAIRAMSVGEDWGEQSTSEHIHDLCGETMRLNMAVIKGSKPQPAA